MSGGRPMAREETGPEWGSPNMAFVSQQDAARAVYRAERAVQTLVSAFDGIR